jgi:pyruvate/2-oxoglutarate dehydrogenase complex dihydrolipoamide dehydrogenase (E3) component
MMQPGRVSPADEHNAELVANVHPPDWQNPEPADWYKLVVIGAGTAGLVTAAGAAGLGARVALVEKHLLGGDCLNVGCVPSKCIVRSARAAADVREAGRYGVRVPEGAEVDFPAVMARMRSVRARISRHDAAERFRQMGVDVFLGEGRFSGPDAVEVAAATLRFNKAVIATGARAVRPDVPGLEEAGFLTNETVFSLTERPGRLVVFGAGPLGVELAQTFQRLGSRVTIVERRGRILHREDPDAARILTESFRRDGVTVMTNSLACGVEPGDGEKVVCVECNGRQERIPTDEILVGAGRAPNVQGLNLEAVRVEYDERRGVVVDDRLRTTNRRIYAAGDVCLRYKFTHTADAAARIVIQNALFWGRKKKSALTVPWCTYTDPEIAHVGMYEQDAHERGIPVATFTRTFDEVDRALADGEEEGFVKVHVREGTDEILGATIVARHAGEMISELTLAMVAGVGLRTLAGVIHPYPTQAEAVKHVADAYNRTRLTPFFKGLSSRLMAWRR